MTSTNGISRRSSVRISGDRAELTLRVSTRTYARLADAADRREVKISELLSTAVDDASVDERVRGKSALRRGWDDWTIATQLEVTVALVAQWRKQLGLLAAEPGKGRGRI